jgi:hypothetical protein
MIELIYHKGRMQLPESFEDLSGKQFIGISKLLFTGGDVLRCKVQALKILCGLSPFKFAFLKAEVISRAIEYVDWVFDEKKIITKQLIPSYKGYHGPISNFDNLRMKEFHMSELYYREMVSQENPAPDASLNNLVAVLYRPAKWFYNKKRDKDGDIRMAFNENEIAYRARKISRWPEKVKQAIFLWYGGCRQKLEEDNEAAFRDDSGSSFESQFDTGMYGVMRSLAGDKLGSVEKIEEMYVHTCMLEIGLIKEEEKYFEEKMKRPA